MHLLILKWFVFLTGHINEISNWFSFFTFQESDIVTEPGIGLNYREVPFHGASLNDNISVTPVPGSE